jgi:hypothetical protein
MNKSLSTGKNDAELRVDSRDFHSSGALSETPSIVTIFGPFVEL